MTEYGPESYGERIADVYDTWYQLGDAEREAVLIEELAGGGRVLELGIGTGRVALPLAARGVEVHGVDASPTMVEQLRRKPGGDAIPVVIGDMADVPVEGEFALVFVVANTFFMLTEPETQLRCMENVARRLQPGGRFLLHVFVPDAARFVRDQNLSVNHIDADGVRIDATTYDPQTQCIEVAQMHMSDAGIRVIRSRLRFAYPNELDLMAKVAGMELESRWGSLARGPFTVDSNFHVSVYRRP